MKSFLSTISPTSLRSSLLNTNQSNVKLIDATWFMPNSPRNAIKEFKQIRLPNSKYFNLDKYIDEESKYPHMLPKLSVMNKAFSELGVSKIDILVVYDKSGIFSSPRAAWQFSLYGHPKVYLLDNYLSYLKCEYPVEETEVQEIKQENSKYEGISEFEFNKNYSDQVIEYEELIDLVKNNQTDNYTIIDARSKERFSGEAPEPRPGLSSGHVPNAKNLPFTNVLTGDDLKNFKSSDEIVKEFENAGIDLNKDIIVMCGTGVTAVILKFAIEKIKKDAKIRVYDGSWTEYASRAPKEYIIKDN
ncbi:unnamed protein product [Candida verbasci]|uniref:Rhodanese domain-containing protein n=1 Tax=Candida verbasci TaxID=1227364 RepID=A0A9W4TWK2_9ASCO|nr:unnamed protein product [Candida verbasci]